MEGLLKENLVPGETYWDKLAERMVLCVSNQLRVEMKIAENVSSTDELLPHIKVEGPKTKMFSADRGLYVYDTPEDYQLTELPEVDLNDFAGFVNHLGVEEVENQVVDILDECHKEILYSNEDNKLSEASIENLNWAVGVVSYLYQKK